MAFRAPQFYYENAYQERGVANFTLTSGTADPDFPLDNLIDDRQQFIFQKSAAVQLILDLDLGASPTTGYDTWLHPRIDQTVQFAASLVEASDAAFTTDVVVLGTISTVQTRNFKLNPFAFGNPTLQRYIRVTQTISDAIRPHPQFVLSKQVTFTRGPVLSGSVDEKAYNFSRLEQISGEAPTIQRAAPQRRLEYTYPALTGADLAAMEALIAAVGMHRPFWVDPHSFSATPDTDDPVLWMKFETEPRVSHALTVPAEGTEAKTFHLNLIEALD